MKLRLRSLETKQTHKIEVPNSCNLQQLKDIISLNIFPSSSSSLNHQQQQQSLLLLSLNKKEQLYGSSPNVSLQSLGITSGDLIYFSQNPNAFSSQNPNLLQLELGKNQNISTCDDKGVDLNDTHMDGTSNLSNFSDLGSTQIVDSCKSDELIGLSSKTQFGNTSDCADLRKNQEITAYDEQGVDLNDTHKVGTSNLSNFSDLGSTQMVESCKGDEFIGLSSNCGDLGSTQVVESSKDNELIGSGSQTRDLMDYDDDEMEVDDEFEIKGHYKFYVPGFLKKVFAKEVGDCAANGGDHKLLVIAVHAVLMESGFVGYDPVSGTKVDGFHLSEEWPSLAFGMTLHYTLDEVSKSEVVETVVLKFQTLGRFVKIYGLLPKKGFGVHQVCLDEPRFLPALSFIFKMSDDYDPSCIEMDESKLYPKKEIFEFWKIVKDGLSYPLLIDLCERVGLVPPPCLMRLPTELKLKILESLPGVDVARVECVCSELRFLASNNDLWKLKYEEEFGNASVSQSGCQWKAKFCSSWEVRKSRKRACRSFRWREPFQRFRPGFPGRRDPNPFGSPFIIGGDYDRLPNLGLPQYPGLRIFRRNNCDLGGLGL